MTYIENVFICMMSPLLIAVLCMGKKQLRFFLFCIAGMGACLFSAYINTFFAAVYQSVRCVGGCRGNCSGDGGGDEASSSSVLSAGVRTRTGKNQKCGNHHCGFLCNI